ncbi:ribbon-helix-helix domain-containing protein [Hyphococcus sp.]|uniref:ribbon-helix-helix domain-containing protein n=1 Tax=Hyphococcus sp. TaxID=2038636 RepID=UPI003CCC3F56
MMQKRSISLKGHRTSIALEAEFWAAIEKVAIEEQRTLPSLIYRIDRDRLTQTPPPGLASAIRVYILKKLSPSD